MSTQIDRLAGLTEGVANKAPCRVATVTEIGLLGLQTIDGVALASGDRVLVKDQTNPIDNGIWIVSSGAWSRSLDCNGSRDAVDGTTIFIKSGAVNGLNMFRINGTDPISVGASGITFSKFLGSSAAVDIGTLPNQIPDNANVIATAQNGDWTAEKPDAITRPIYLKLRDEVSAFDDMSGSLAAAIDASEVTSADATEISTKLNGLIDNFGTRGGKLLLPKGLYYTKPISALNKTRIVGDSFGSVILRAPDGLDGQIIYTPGQVSNTSTDYFSLENLIFDGNAANVARAVAASAVAINGFQRFSARHCSFINATGYGLGLQAHPGIAMDAPQTECYLEDIYLDDNGIGAIGGTDTYDGLDVKDIDILTLVGVWARRNADRGINLRGTAISIFGGGAEGNGFNSPQGLTAGLEIVANSDAGGGEVATDASVFGFTSRGNAGAGYSFANGSGVGTRAVKVALSGCKGTANGTYGVETQAGSSLVELTVDGGNFYGNTSHGISLHSSTKSAGFTNTILSGNGGSGLYTDMVKARFNGGHIFGNARYAVEAGANGTRTYITGGTQVANDNTLGRWKFNAGGRYHVSPDVIDYDAGASTDGDIIASAATITLPEGGRSFTITGTTTITAITPSARDRVVTLIFTGALTVTHGSLLRLVGGTNKTTANHHTLTIVFDGSSWVECAYAAAA